MKEAFEKIKELLVKEIHPLNNACWNDAIEEAIRIVKQVAEKHDRKWIPVSDRLPEITEYYQPYWVTILAQDKGKKFYYVRKATWNQYDKHWEWSNAKAVSYKINIIAWKDYEIPAPYQPKG